MQKQLIGELREIELLRETDKYSLYKVLIDTISLTTFDKGIKDHFKIGEKVLCNYEDDGKYKTIKSIKEYSEEAEKKYKDYTTSMKEKESEIFKTNFQYNGENMEIAIKKI